MSVSRREFLALLGTSVAATAAVAVAGAEGVAPQGATPPVAGRWIVDQIGAVSKGAVPITLRHDLTGEVLHIEACKRSASANPIASSARFDLFLANDGAGRAPTARHHVAAVRSLAEHLDRAEVPHGVVTMAEREAIHAELRATADDASDFVRV